MEISVRKRRGKKFAIHNFYSISQTCYVSGKSVILALTRKFPDFLPRGGNLLRFRREHPLSKEIFLTVKIGQAFFFKNPPDLSPKKAFRQNKAGREGGSRNSRPSFFTRPPGTRIREKSFADTYLIITTDFVFLSPQILC